ncbi:hypothetical protein PVAND_006088 [Polypedilum vanderplanki]|uniref:DNA polymerase theta-like protein n=1 Tax=Polypedilum vanderplanki TaxID=319348 RepID=A0A9J6C2H8_POLVA|nr:hypothetical protein PVAND_006088 [Polypedilum vanderplanki]
MESISQMLNVDNSIFFDVNTQVFNEVPNNNSHKRRSDDRLSKLDHKKAKIHSENARHKTDSAILPKQNIRNEKIKQEKVLETHKANNSIFSDSICSEDLIRVCEETDKYMKVEPHSSNEIKIEKSSSPLLKPTKSFKKPKVNVSGYLTKLKRKQSQTFKTEPSSSSSQNKPPLSQSVLNEIKELDNLNFSSDVSQNYNSSFNWSQSTVIFNENENIEIKHNPVTGSQYIQEKSESLDDSNVTKRQQFYASRNPIKELEIINEGEFFGLGKKFKKHLQTVKRITNLYDWQEECLKLDAIDKRRNLVYALPTSGGKTLVSEILMLREVLLRKKNVIFILPYVSIVQEKINDLLPFACEYDFFVEEYCSGKGKLPPIKRRKKNSIYVCTIEKANILIDSLIELERLDEISLIVVDELHMIGDSYRGYVLELLLTKIIYFDKIPIQIVGMSATIANLQDVANFLFADIYTRNFRPIELQEYVKVDGDLYMVDYKATNANDAFKLIEPNVDKVLSEKTEKRDPSMITPCIYECVKEEGSCLIFCSTKKNCENVALLLVDCLPKTVLETKKQERIQLINAMKMDSNGKICPVLARSIPCGIAYHNSSLTNDERRHIEEAFRAGVLNVICCTSTLAAGVNLPAKRVVIRSPYVGSSFLTLSKYKQMIGRAGRAGIVETGESFLLCTQKDYLNVVKMLTSTMDFTLSGFLERKSIIRTCVLNLIVVKICKTIKELLKFSSCLLAHIQRKQYDKDIEKMFIDVIKELMVENAILQKTNDPKCSETIHVFVGDKRIEVTFNDELEINKFGQAAMKAGMNLEEAKSIDKELRKESGCFTMSSFTIHCSTFRSL